MRIVGFGDLFIDYYLNNGLVIGICGGKTNANIIANLSKYFKTAFIGVVGNDLQGQVCLASLNKLGCDTKNVKVIPERTKIFFMNNNSSGITCPACGRKASYEDLKFQAEDVTPLILEDDILVVDNVTDEVLKVLNSVTNKAFLDLGHLNELFYLSLEEIVAILKNRFEIINMNIKVMNKLHAKFGIDAVDLYELTRPKIFILTKGKKGADIIYEGGIIEKEILDPINEVESSGAGDAFFAEFIRTIIENNYEINEKIISLAYMRGSAIARFCVTNYGARTHLEPLYKIDNYHECICRDIDVKL